MTTRSMEQKLRKAAKDLLATLAEPIMSLDLRCLKTSVLDGTPEDVHYHPIQGEDVLIYPDGRVETGVGDVEPLTFRPVDGAHRQHLIQSIVDELAMQDQVWSILDAYQARWDTLRALSGISPVPGSEDEVVHPQHPDREWKSKAWFKSIEHEVVNRTYAKSELYRLIGMRT